MFSRIIQMIMLLALVSVVGCTPNLLEGNKTAQVEPENLPLVKINGNVITMRKMTANELASYKLNQGNMSNKKGAKLQSVTSLISQYCTVTSANAPIIEPNGANFIITHSANLHIAETQTYSESVSGVLYLVLPNGESYVSSSFSVGNYAPWYPSHEWEGTDHQILHTIELHYLNAGYYSGSVGLSSPNGGTTYGPFGRYISY